MKLISVNPKTLKAHPDNSRKSKADPQSDAMLLSSIKTVGIIQPPVVTQFEENGDYTIIAGHRRIRQAVKAGLTEIPALVTEAADDQGVMKGVAENVVREPLNPVDQFRAIELLIAKGWSEEGVAQALALTIRQVRKLRLMACLHSPILKRMEQGDMPKENQLRVIASASIEQQEAAWKKVRPSREENVNWYLLANYLETDKREACFARFDDKTALNFCIEWCEDLFAPADVDSRYTTNVEAFDAAQIEWILNNKGPQGDLLEYSNYGPKLPPKAERHYYSEPKEGDRIGYYLNPRNGEIETVLFSVPEPVKKKKIIKKVLAPVPQCSSKSDTCDNSGISIVEEYEEIEVYEEETTSRPDITQKGLDIIGRMRTEALREAFDREVLSESTLLALLIIAFSSNNVFVSGSHLYNLENVAASLLKPDGSLNATSEEIQSAARCVLSEVVSMERNYSYSGEFGLVIAKNVDADQYLPNMAQEEFLKSLSRPVIEQLMVDLGKTPEARVRDSRQSLLDHFKENPFIYEKALMSTDEQILRIQHYKRGHDEDEGFDDSEVLAKKHEDTTHLEKVPESDEILLADHSAEETNMPETKDTIDEIMEKHDFSKLKNTSWGKNHLEVVHVA